MSRCDAMIKVLDFYADWCGPCRAMEPAIKEIDRIVGMARKDDFRKAVETHL